ncbi:hypothetical protein RhiirC2_780818 [Rhizophagus irregularis]|uniref:Uncharacterized protein n=1 Tax=Rhizophagus irregularis TaxID=588596 RepID=A0A2N1N6Y8_9GLOM|nr:hypothetical protein RhiirC2_780818 [Rhizophagus irregularis]
MFTFLLEQTLQVFKTTSATCIYQTATDFEPAIYKHLEGLQTTYADEFYELGVPKYSFNAFLFFAINFKDAYTCLLYETAKDYMGKKEKASHIKIIEKLKYQSLVIPPVIQTKLNVQAQPYASRGKKCVTYADIAKGSSFDDFWSTSPSLKDKWNIQSTSAKGSTNIKSQQQKIKKSKLTLEKMISTVMTGYIPKDKANICEIVIYDIHSTMLQLDILTNLEKWDQWTLTNWNNGVWTAPFRRIPV